MRITALLLIVSFCMFSCGNDDDTIPSREEYTFVQNSEIELEVFGESSIAQTIEGDNIVFQYRFISEDDPDTADEEYTETIIFEIDPELEAFSYSNEELLNAATYFTRYCFCSSINSIPIESGNIEGTKLNNGNWQISIDVSFMLFNDEVVTKTANGIFILE